MFNTVERYEILCIETAEEYFEKKAIALERAREEADIYKKSIEAKGVCEGCGSTEYIRWVHNDECYLCAECFIHDLQCQADVMVPMHRVDDMDGYDEYLSWDELWEEENGFV